jgi:vancomycin resistance protein YoaR
MRVTVAILAVVVVAVLGRFVWDDILSTEDIPRGVTVNGVPIGDLDRAAAGERLLAEVNADRSVELIWDGGSTPGTLAQWGVEIDTEATLDAAEDARGGAPLRLVRWAAAVLRDRRVDPVWKVDTDTLTDAIRREPEDLAVVDSAIVLAPTGEFVSTEAPQVPVVDIDALASALLEAANNEALTVINVPTRGFEAVENSDGFAAAANRLTSPGLRVILAGQFEEREIPSSTLREWLVVDGAETLSDLKFDPDQVAATLRELYPTVGTDNATDEETDQETGVEFVIGFDGEVYIVGALPGSECCDPDTAATLMTALRAGTDAAVPVFPVEPPDAEGLAWAESLGIKELVGEFTTFYKPNQTRIINIARISEITRGAIIEPGETFSVNEFVGPRTTADGFVSAGVISNGTFSSSVGGGISQYATTLFNAAFFAGLDFGQYQSHSIYISRYPYGREATVSFPFPNLEIINTTPYGILLWPTTNEDSITVRLYSTKWVSGEQTGQTERREGVSCTRVTTERTRTWVEDGRTEIDTVTARYRPEGVACNGASTRPTTTTTSTTSTVPTSVP